MDTLIAFIKKHPLISSMGISILFGLLILIPLKAIYLNVSGDSELTLKTKYILGFVQRLFGFSVCLFLIIKLGYTKALSFGTACGWKALAVVWPAGVLIFFNMPYDLMLAGNYNPDVSLILPLVLRYTGVGLIEEGFFRGLILSVLLAVWGINKKGIYKSVIISSIFFGLVHLVNLMNLLKGEQVFVETVSQVFYATFLGIFFAAVYLRTNNLWLAVIIHSLFDIADGLYSIAIKAGNGALPASTIAATSITDALFNAVLALPFALFGLFILRKVTIKNDSPVADKIYSL